MALDRSLSARAAAHQLSRTTSGVVQLRQLYPVASRMNARDAGLMNPSTGTQASASLVLTSTGQVKPRPRALPESYPEVKRSVQ